MKPQYNLRNVVQRPLSTLTTTIGIALVVAILVGALALASGFQAALVETPTLFSRRPASYVSPPVRIFVRDDVWFSRRFER